jgi:hypothetical protein
MSLGSQRATASLTRKHERSRTLRRDRHHSIKAVQLCATASSSMPCTDSCRTRDSARRRSRSASTAPGQARPLQQGQGAVAHRSPRWPRSPSPCRKRIVGLPSTDWPPTVNQDGKCKWRCAELTAPADGPYLRSEIARHQPIQLRDSLRRCLTVSGPEGRQTSCSTTNVPSPRRHHQKSRSVTDCLHARLPPRSGHPP